MNIQILFTTERGAMLVTNQDKVVWLKPDEKNEDGTFKNSALVKLNESELSYQQYLIDQEESRKDYLEQLNTIQNSPYIVEEHISTEKAIGVLVFMHREDSKQTKCIWIPKSMIDENGCTPKWFFDKQLAKLTEELSSSTEWMRVIA